jgi:hypothetical protein
MEHHTPEMIDFFLKYEKKIGFLSKRMKFVIFGTAHDNQKIYKRLKLNNGNLIFIDGLPKHLEKFIKNLNVEDCLILHSSFIKWMWPILLLNRGRKGLLRTAWICWGADLLPGIGIKGKVYDSIKKVAVRRLGAVAGLDENDRNILINTFKMENNIVPAFYSNFDYDWEQKLENCTDSFFDKSRHYNVLLGNSAWPEGNHLEALERLAEYRENKVTIFCPLGYPEKSDYKNQIIKKGKKLLGEKFYPIVDLIEKHKYIEMLNSMDILAFNNYKQQGLFSVYFFLCNGKKVFLRKDGATYSALTRVGMKIYDSETISNLNFDKFIRFSRNEAETNIALARNHISAEAAAKGWNLLLQKITN